MSKSRKYYVNKPRYTDGEIQKAGGSMLKNRTRILAVLTLCLLLFTVSGCGGQQGATPVPTETPSNDYLNIDPERRPMKQKITLFYMHKASGLLVPVTRTEYKEDTSMERFVMDELIKGPGPGNEILSAVIPEGADIIDVEMTGTTAFVYFNSGITGDLPFQSLWGDAYTNEDQQLALEQESHELMLYSIVNTLTGLPGVAHVKILIENRIATYAELGLESLAQAYGVDPDTSMPSFTRSVDYILQPADVVQHLMTELSADQPVWQEIYPFLYDKMADGTSLPGMEEMKRQWSIRRIAFDQESIVPQEMRGDNTALVAASYAIERTNGPIETVNLEYLHMICQNGVWKLEMPPTWLGENYGY